MNKEYELIARSNERWQRRNLSRVLAIFTGVFCLAIYLMDLFRR